MKSKFLFVAILLVVISCSSVFGVEIYLDLAATEGLNGEGQIEPESTIVFHVWLDFDTTVVKIYDSAVWISNGYRIYTEDAVTWDTTILLRNPAYDWDLLDGFPCIFDYGYKEIHRNSDGMASDTVAFSGMDGTNPAYGSGIWPGFCDMGYTITCSTFAGQSAGTIVIDSSWYTPHGKWEWGLLDNTSLEVNWGGPYIFEYTGDEAVENVGGEALPGQFRLAQNYPNPFNPSTEILFDLPTASHVRLNIFNILGQRVCTLVDESVTAGYHKVTWDGTNDAGSGVPSGIYFYKIDAGDFVESKKMMMLK